MLTPRWKLNRLTRGLLFAAAVYGGLAAMARILAGQALYHPDLASREKVPGTAAVTDDAGRSLAVLHLPNPEARFTLWFFPGNAEAIGDLRPTAQLLHESGFAFFAFDYPGYGNSTGEPGEAELYSAARAARKYLRETLQVPAERTILYGRSLGGGPAVQLATEERVAGLVLQSAFTSVYRVLTQRRIFPGDLFENERKLPRVEAPVLVLHGRDVSGRVKPASRERVKTSHL